MLALNGNTAPFMLYAFARVQGIARKAQQLEQQQQLEQRHGIEAPPQRGGGAEITVSTKAAAAAANGPSSGLYGHPAERALATHLLRLPEVVARLEADLLPSSLCDFLFELSQRFNRFYEACPVLAAPDAPTRASRAALATLTASTLKLGLGLLGIGTLDRL